MSHPDKEFIDNWIIWFCNLRENKYFCQVDEDYIKDKFNLTGLSELVPEFKHGLEIILNIKHTFYAEKPAELLYGLIHARFILTNRGIAKMVEKYKNKDFGCCPRMYCHNQPVLPIGLSDMPRESMVKLYCPKCMDIYTPNSSRYKVKDGAFFGTTFPHMLLMVRSELRPKIPAQQFVSRLYGFKIHPSAYDNHKELEKHIANKLV